jgi:hypothetical protein
MKKLPDIEEVFHSFKPINDDYMDHFLRAKGGNIKDIGILGSVLWVTMDCGDLLITFADKNVFIEPHAYGEVIQYHEFQNNQLDDMSAYMPNGSEQSLYACIFVFNCQNVVFEYLISPQTAETLNFKIEFIPHGVHHA